MIELATKRFYWNTGTVGDGRGYSTKLSAKLLWEPRDLWIGVYWHKKDESLFVYICFVPLLPIRIHYKRSYGGRYV